MATTNDFSNLTPTHGVVPRELNGEFFDAAPTDTVVELGGHLYQRIQDGRWLALHEVFVDHSFVWPGANYEGYSPDELEERANEMTTLTLVLRFGSPRS